MTLGFSGKHSRLALDALSTSLDHNHLVDSAVRAKHFAAAAGGAHALEVAAPPKAGHDGSAHGVSKFHEEKRLHDENKAAVGAAEWDRDARKGERGREGAVPFANDDDDAHGGALIARTQVTWPQHLASLCSSCSRVAIFCGELPDVAWFECRQMLERFECGRGASWFLWMMIRRLSRTTCAMINSYLDWQAS